jgi:endogenous inhibitor of DNA gyrase (YacG/DUF329 family)
MKLTSKESNDIKSRGLYIADKCDSCGKPLNQKIRYTRADRKGRVFCSAECCDLAGNGEELPEATLPQTIASSVVHELIAEKVYGSCESCGLPLREGIKAMHIPDLPGLYHCVLCAEQAIYERGCRFCGKPLSSNSQRFCSDRCANEARACRFGDGNRLLAWLRAHSPELVGGVRRSEDQALEERKCASCRSPLNGKRRQAKYCSKACQKRDERFRTATGTGKSQRSLETATATLYLQGVTGTESAQTVSLGG